MVRDAVAYTQFQFLWRIISRGTIKKYWFNNKWKRAELQIDTFKVTGKKDFYDTVAYTIFGPVMYDKSYSGGRATNDRYYAVRWKAHDPSNEMMLFYKL